MSEKSEQELSNELGEGLEAFILSITRASKLVEGTVSEIDADPNDPESAFNCSVLVGQTTFSNVPLRVLLSTQSSFIEVPVLNTNCLMLFRDGNQGRPQLLMVDQVDQFLINNNKTVFNKGNNNGMVLLMPLLTAINNLQKLMNEFINTYNSHTHNVTAVGSPTGPAIPLENSTSEITVQQDLENTKILQ